MTAAISLGLNAWDDFYHHGSRVGGKKFGVDVLGALSGIVITAALTGIVGPMLGGAIGLGISIYIGETFFNPVKDSIK